jgi:hypothetical protein
MPPAKAITRLAPPMAPASPDFLIFCSGLYPDRMLIMTNRKVASAIERYSRICHTLAASIMRTPRPIDDQKTPDSSTRTTPLA